MKGRGRTYGLAVEQVILVVWESLDYICAERLTPALLSTAQHLARFGTLHLSSEVEDQLNTVQIVHATGGAPGTMKIAHFAQEQQGLAISRR